MTLTIQDLGSLGEFFGSLAVLATLIYLALQTRQNTTAIAAQLDVARISALQTNCLTRATSSELLEAMAEDAITVSTINPRLSAYWLAILTSFQWQFHQARRGLLPGFQESERGLGASVTAMFINSRRLAGYWEAIRAGFSSEFVEWVEEQRSKAA